MSKKLFSLITLLTLCFASFNANAGTDGKVASLHGKVVDAANYEGIAGATIEVEGTDIKVFTDFEGNFTLPALPEGTYTIKSTLVSYNEVKLRNIRIAADSQGTLELKLHSN